MIWCFLKISTVYHLCQYFVNFTQFYIKTKKSLISHSELFYKMGKKNEKNHFLSNIDEQ